MATNSLKAAAQKKNVFEFLGYREYLASIYSELKSKVPGYSYLKFSSDLGFSETNVIRLIIVGKRNLSLRHAQVIADSLELKNDQRRYFLALIPYVNKKTTEGREKLLQKLLLWKGKSLSTESEQRKLSYFSKWYHPVIREMAKLKGFRADPEWIAKRLSLHVSTKDIALSLNLLENLGLILRNSENGSACASEENLSVLPGDPTAENIAIIKYHQETLDVAKNAVAMLSSDKVEVNNLTLCVSKQASEKIKERIRELCAEIMELERVSQDSNDVMQLSIQFFSFLDQADSIEKGE